MEGILGGMMSRKHATFETFTMIWLVMNIIVNMEGILGGMTSRKLAVQKIIARLSLFFKVT